MNHRVPIYRTFRFQTLLFYVLVVLLAIAGIASAYFTVYSIIFSYLLLIDFVYGLILFSNKVSRADENPSQRLSFNSEGVRVNGMLMYPWGNIRNIVYHKIQRRVTIEANLNPRFEFIPELTHTLRYGRLEITLENQRVPSVVLKVPFEIHRFRRLLLKMERYAKASNSETSFYLQERPEKALPTRP